MKYAIYEAGSVIIFLIAIFYTATIFDTVVHEENHKAVFKNNGCKNVSIEYGAWRTSGETRCLDQGQKVEVMMKDQNEVEIIQYTTYKAILALLGLPFIMYGISRMRWER